MDSSELYRSGVNYGPVWICRPCQAWVGCHKYAHGSKTVPKGRLANKELRDAKIAAHAAFDPFQDRMGRARAYKWLSKQLGIPGRDCHIGMFDVNQCRRVVAACQVGAKQ